MSYEKVSQAKNLIIGTKQTVRALKSGQATEVFVALDADPQITKALFTQLMRWMSLLRRWTP